MLNRLPSLKTFTRRYLVTTGITAFLILMISGSATFHVDLYRLFVRALDRFVHFIDDDKIIQTEEILLAMGLFVLALLIDQMRMLNVRKRNEILNETRLDAMRSTLATVHDTVNNSLNNLLIVKLEAGRRGALSEETLTLFGNLIEGIADDLRRIEETDAFSQRDLAQDLRVLDLSKS